MVAKFLDDNKPKGPLKKSLKRHLKSEFAKPVSVKGRLRTADCRLQTRGKMQTECKMQTAD